MQNTGKQTREDEDSMTLISSSTWNPELLVSASAGHLWYGRLGQRNQRRETLACVISKSKLNYLSLPSSCNFSSSFNQDCYRLSSVLVGQYALCKSTGRDSAHFRKITGELTGECSTHIRELCVPNVSDNCCSSSSPRLAVQFIQKRRGRWPAQPCSQLLLHCWAWRGFQRHQPLL